MTTFEDLPLLKDVSYQFSENYVDVFVPQNSELMFTNNTLSFSYLGFPIEYVFINDEFWFWIDKEHLYTFRPIVYSINSFLESSNISLDPKEVTEARDEWITNQLMVQTSVYFDSEYELCIPKRNISFC